MSTVCIIWAILSKNICIEKKEDTTPSITVRKKKKVSIKKVAW